MVIGPLTGRRVRTLILSSVDIFHKSSLWREFMPGYRSVRDTYELYGKLLALHVSRRCLTLSETVSIAVSHLLDVSYFAAKGVFQHQFK